MSALRAAVLCVASLAGARGAPALLGPAVDGFLTAEASAFADASRYRAATGFRLDEPVPSWFPRRIREGNSSPSNQSAPLRLDATHPRDSCKLRPAPGFDDLDPVPALKPLEWPQTDQLQSAIAHQPDNNFTSSQAWLAPARPPGCRTMAFR